jgi:sulfhydrogenase subunit beta (sulfur reductase)
VNNAETTTSGFLDKNRLDDLIAVLHDQGYTVIGPTIEQDAIVYDVIQSAADLPVGWTDQQQPGSYQLQQTNDGQYFGYVVGPHSWKKFLFPPQSVTSTAHRTEQGWQFRPHQEQTPPRYAFLGVRACELAAIRRQDHIFTTGHFVDPIYAGRRKSALIVAVNCTQAASTCFCTSMNTGPRCTEGYDVGLTETQRGFVLECGSAKGAAVMAALPLTEVTELDMQSADSARAEAVNQIERRIDTAGLRELLLANPEHPRWEELGRRCLSCTNCTMVCPTCFCSTVEDVADLAGDNVERQRRWDSCFNPDFSYMNGSIVRSNIRSRYRQWLMHKLATWHDQFGESGCVGCGRCITWCPPGIDLTAEVAEFQAQCRPDSDQRKMESQP